MKKPAIIRLKSKKTKKKKTRKNHEYNYLKVYKFIYNMYKSIFKNDNKVWLLYIILVFLLSEY